MTLEFMFYVCVQRRTQLQEQMSFRYKERLKCQTLPIKQEQVHSFRKALLILLQFSVSFVLPCVVNKKIVP